MFGRDFMAKALFFSLLGSPGLIFLPAMPPIVRYALSAL